MAEDQLELAKAEASLKRTFVKQSFQEDIRARADVEADSQRKKVDKGLCCPAAQQKKPEEVTHVSPLLLVTSSKGAEKINAYNTREHAPTFMRWSGTR